MLELQIRQLLEQEGIAPLIERAKEFFYSPLGIAIGSGAIASMAAGAVKHRLQQKEANVFPVVFSGIEQFDANNLNEAARFYAAVNDIAMAVTKAWNTAREARSYVKFYESIPYTDIREKTEVIQREGQILLSNLGDYFSIGNLSASAASEFYSSWDYRKQDNTIEVQTGSIPITNEKGEQIGETPTYTSIYVDTDHYFDFYRDRAEAARQHLEALISQFNPKELYNSHLEKLVIKPVSFDLTSIGNTVFEDKEKEVTEEEASSYINQWTRHAIIVTATGTARRMLATLRKESPQKLKVIINSDDEYHYKVASTEHDGPSGYQYSMHLGNQCKEIADSMGSLQWSIEACMENAQGLVSLLETGRYFHIQNHRKLAHKSIDFAVESYLAAFPSSEINMDQRVKLGNTALAALGAGLAVGIAAYFLAYYIQN